MDCRADVGVTSLQLPESKSAYQVLVAYRIVHFTFLYISRKDTKDIALESALLG